MSVKSSSPWVLRSRSRLAALGEKKPSRKSAQIRALWPDIRTAIENGHSLREICDCLKDDGITISATTLGSYVARIRKKQATETPTLRKSAPLQPAGRNADQPEGAPIRSDPPRDPLKNIRERAADRSVFDYRPELADPAKLI
jgi:hypothetical protein